MQCKSETSFFKEESNQDIMFAESSGFICHDLREINKRLKFWHASISGLLFQYYPEIASTLKKKKKKKKKST